MLTKFFSKISSTVKDIIAVVLAAILAITVVFSAGAISSCADNSSKPIDAKWKGVKAEQVTDGYEKGFSKAPQTAEYLGEVEPVKPVEGVKDEHEKWGVETYPSYGKNLGSLPEAKFNAILYECRDLIPAGTWHSSGTYSYIDKDGYLLDKNGARIPYSLNGDGGDLGDGDGGDDGTISEGFEGGDESESGSATASTQFKADYRMLYTHTTAATLYGGGLSDDEPRIAKTITCVSHPGGEGAKQMTGLYAPGGEVIKIQMSEADYNAVGGVNVYIGQSYNIEANDAVALEWNVSNGVATAKGNTGFNRIPHVLSHFKFAANAPSSVVTRENGLVTFYVGSFWGGPIYYRPNSNFYSKTFSITISGGVRYQHFILGATSEAEYNLNKTSTAPYFDLEVYDSAIRFTTGKAGAASLSNMTYQDCTDAAILWDKITQVSKRVQNNGLTSTVIPVSFIGDCYIAAGAAYANPGRNGVVCPPGWVASALNYKSFVNNGDWGSMHEYNHCWQGYGLGNGGEVTNNATTLVAYSLYTRISASRTSSVGWANGDWIRFTDPSKSLGEALTIGAQSNNGSPQKNFDLSAYATLLHNIGQDMFLTAAHGGRESGSTVYYNQLTNATHTDMTYYFTDVLNFTVGGATGDKGSITQDAVNAATAKKYPVFVPVSSVYQVGRSITTLNEKGKKEKQYITTAQPYTYGFGEFIMDFNNQNDFANGSFVSKSLVIPDGFTVKVSGVTQPENGKVKLLKNNQVQYTPKNGADGLYSGEFTVKLKITKNDKAFKVDDVELVINLKQSNYLDRTTYVYDDASKVPDTAAVYDAKKKSFNFGKYSSTETIPNVTTQETNTQIWRSERNFYDKVYNADSENYKELPLNQTLQTMEGVLYFSNPNNTYRFTLKGRGKSTLYLSFDKGKTWESALTIERSSGNAYIDSEYYEKDLSASDGVVYYKVVHLVTKAQDFFGVGVASKKADGTFNSFANASAYRNETFLNDATQKFTTEYRYKNNYTYSYKKTESLGSLVSINYEPWDANQSAENMFDGNSNTYFHSKGSNDGSTYITEQKPLELIADLGEICTVNTVTFNGYYRNDVTNNGMVKSFKLYGSKDNKKYTLLTEQTDMVITGRVVTLSFDETEMRYYKLVVTKTDNGRYFAMNSIAFSVSFPDGKTVAPNDFYVRYEKNKKTEGWTTENVLCTYGLIYKANAKDYAEFHFTGTRFAYFAYQSPDYGTVDIYVDGKKVASDVSLSEGSGSSLVYMYTGKALKNRDHVVKIVGKSGAFNVDSFVYWDK